MTKPITATLEQSQKFKELGIEFEDSYFIWDQIEENKWRLTPKNQSSFVVSFYNAPQFEEIIAKLPSILDIDSKLVLLRIHKVLGVYQVEYSLDRITCLPTVSDLEIKPDKDHIFLNKILTHALADMLIWCGENNHLGQ